MASAGGGSSFGLAHWTTPGPALRESEVTSWPAASSFSTSARPTFPVAPVTVTFMYLPPESVDDGLELALGLFGYGLGDRLAHVAVEDARHDVLLVELLVGHRAGDSLGGGDLHLVGDRGGARVQRTPEHTREGQHVVDLVRVVRASGGHHARVGAGLLGMDLGVGVGHREHEGLGV